MNESLPLSAKYMKKMKLSCFRKKVHFSKTPFPIPHTCIWPSCSTQCDYTSEVHLQQYSQLIQRQWQIWLGCVMILSWGENLLQRRSIVALKKGLFLFFTAVTPLWLHTSQTLEQQYTTAYILQDPYTYMLLWCFVEMRKY